MKKFAFILAAFMFIVAPLAMAETFTTGTTTTTTTTTTGTTSTGKKVEDRIKNMEEKLNDMKERQDKVKVSKTEDIACTKTAVSKREGSLATAFDTFTASMKQALTTRKAALEAAYDQTDKATRVKARNDAWQAFNTASKSAHSAMKSARKAAYATFKTDAKACGTTSTDSEPKGESDKVSI